MSDPSTNPTMIDISITETVDNSKDTDNLSNDNKKAKTTSDEERNQKQQTIKQETGK